jgi:hypothetical protein
MTTKESILDQHVKYAWECDQASPVIPYSEAEKAMDEWAGHLISGSQSVTTTYQVPKHILDEYAKQQAIAFDVWKRENCITYDYENNAYSKLIFLDVDHTKVRTEQLSIDDTYNQFIEQQTENK